MPCTLLLVLSPFLRQCLSLWSALSTCLRQCLSLRPVYLSGAAQYPKFLAHLLELGWRNVSQMMPADLCGLV